MIFIGRILTEETKKKRRIVFYNKAIEKAKLEIGKKYNRLTITDIDYEKSYDSYFNKKYHRIYVRTKCDCGEIPPPNQLASIQCRHIKSCGCSKFNNPLKVEDLTGQKFGRLTVIGRDLQRDEEEYKNGTMTNAHWLCKCDCGNPQIKSVTGYQLKTGHTQSCGCYASEQIAKRNKEYSTKTNKFIDNGDNTYYLLDDNNNKWTKDFTRKLNGNLEDVDCYIDCMYGNKVFHYGRDVLQAYIPSLGRGHNILKSINEIDQSIIFDIEETDSEILFKFKYADSDKIIPLLKPKTSGANISPFSSRNLPKNKTFKIPDEQLEAYQEIVSKIPQERILTLTHRTNSFIKSLATKRNPIENIKADMKLKGLRGKEYIYSIGEWDNYIKFLKENI